MLYCDEKQRQQFTLKITDDGRFMGLEPRASTRSDATDASCGDARVPYDYVNTGPAGWIFCVHNYILYAGSKKTTSPR